MLSRMGGVASGCEISYWKYDGHDHSAKSVEENEVEKSSLAHCSKSQWAIGTLYAGSNKTVRNLIQMVLLFLCYNE